MSSGFPRSPIVRTSPTTRGKPFRDSNGHVRSMKTKGRLKSRPLQSNTHGTTPRPIRSRRPAHPSTAIPHDDDDDDDDASHVVREEHLMSPITKFRRRTLTEEDIDILPYVRDVKAALPSATFQKFPRPQGKKAWQETVATKRRAQDRTARQRIVNENRLNAKDEAERLFSKSTYLRREAERTERWADRQSELAQQRTVKRMLESRNRRVVRLARRQADADEAAYSAINRKRFQEEKVLLDLYNDMMKAHKGVAIDLDKHRRDTRKEAQRRFDAKAQSRQNYLEGQLRLVEENVRSKDAEYSIAAKAQADSLRRLQNEQKAAARASLRASRDRLDVDGRNASHLEREARRARDRLRLVPRAATLR